MRKWICKYIYCTNDHGVQKWTNVVTTMPDFSKKAGVGLGFPHSEDNFDHYGYGTSHLTGRSGRGVQRYENEWGLTNKWNVPIGETW